jgi:DNA-binding MarR family transcriptional regulator
MNKYKLTNPNDKDLAFTKLRYDPNTKTHKHSKTTNQPFIRGPIPLNWIKKASAIDGKALNVGLSLWFMHGVKQSVSFRTTRETLRIANCSRQTFSRSLDSLELSGLIKVARSSGRRPEVTILLNPSNEKYEVKVEEPSVNNFIDELDTQGAQHGS